MYFNGKISYEELTFEEQNVIDAFRTVFLKDWLSQPPPEDEEGQKVTHQRGEESPAYYWNQRFVDWCLGFCGAKGLNQAQSMRVALCCVNKEFWSDHLKEFNKKHKLS